MVQVKYFMNDKLTDMVFTDNVNVEFVRKAIEVEEAKGIWAFNGDWCYNIKMGRKIVVSEIEPRHFSADYIVSINKRYKELYK